MGGADQEVEVKLRFESAEAARQSLERLGARPKTPRSYEDNVLFDRADSPLKSAHKLLRLRQVDDRSWLTFKAPVPGQQDERHRVRLEYETGIEDIRAMRLTLEALGFVAEYRYQKYRTTFELPELEICLDETPIGVFVELEGAAEAIDRAAETLGFGVDDYIRESYREIHLMMAAASGVQPGDMVFAGGDS